MSRCFDWLKDDGRFCLNIPLDKNKGGQQSVGADITTIAKQIGYQYHSTIIWNEGNISRRTAWGSWMSASAPYVIAPVELIVVLYKQHWKKQSGSRVNNISRDEFMAWTNGLWTFNGESKKRIGHPAPFPLELPDRAIKLFSFVGDTVLDPFMGSGTTLIAARANKRIGIGIDIDVDYCALARRRLMLAQADYYAPAYDVGHKMKKLPSLSDLVFSYFEERPFIELAHNDWVDEIMAQYEMLHGRVPRDPWRAARKLHEEGKLQKVSKGVYKYDPRLVFDARLEEFTPQQRQVILQRDEFRCVICGRGRADGLELHVDHIKPRDKGGRAIIDNGQTLCSEHNFMKKNLNATESGKRQFMRLYDLAKLERNQAMMDFCAEVLAVYEKHDMNGHIRWTP